MPIDRIGQLLQAREMIEQFRWGTGLGGSSIMVGLFSAKTADMDALRCWLLLLFVLVPVSLYADERPKVGLVLSGGAARGLAHIGVLKALEEQNIAIDFIAGTSMGAAVGGLYAAGWRAQELERMVLELDWQWALSDTQPRQQVPFRRKQDDRDFLLKQKLSFRDDGSLGLPLGVIQGQNLNLLLESWLVHSNEVRDFDKLPIPFRAVATDIASGEKVVFAAGHLPQAIRASMSIPAAFTPAEVDGRLLVDGGMVDNIPIDVARQMGATRIIAIDIGTPLAPREQLKSVFDVLNQTTTLMTRKNSEAQLATLKSDDILIQPALSAYGSGDFIHAEQIIEAGYQAASQLAAQLAHLPQRRNQATAALSQPPIISAILIENTSKVSREVIRRHIHQPLNAAFDLNRLKADMATLYGLDYFDQVKYRISDNTLIIQAIGKRSGSHHLRLGFSFSDDLRGDSHFNLAASARLNGLNRLGAEWLTRGQLGERQELYSEFYQPLDVASRYFIAPWLLTEARNTELFTAVSRDPIARYRLTRHGLGLNLGRQIGNRGELRFGLGHNWGQAKVRIGDASLPDYDFKEGFYELNYAYDSLDNANFPRSGRDMALELRQYEKHLGSDNNYRRWQFRFDQALSHGRNHWLLGGHYGRTLDKVDVVSSSFETGGARQLSGFRQNALSGQNLSLARAIYYHRLTSQNVLLDFPLYLGGSVEYGRVWNNNGMAFDSGYIRAGSLFVAFDTPLGPLSFSYGVNDMHRSALYLNFGQSF